jgi:hypothetical protein
LEGERASEGRGCLERGTLNADRKANQREATQFNYPASWRGYWFCIGVFDCGLDLAEDAALHSSGCCSSAFLQRFSI